MHMKMAAGITVGTILPGWLCSLIYIFFLYLLSSFLSQHRSQQKRPARQGENT